MNQAIRTVALRAVSLQARRTNATQATANANSRRMVYPYTLSAKLAQFPYKFHFDNIWHLRYLPISFVIVTYLFWKIQKAACSPENKAKWAEIRRKEAEEHGDH